MNKIFNLAIISLCFSFSSNVFALFDSPLCPESKTGTVVHHQYYMLNFRSDYRVAEWSCHEIKKDRIIIRNAVRSNTFKADPDLPGSPGPGDYRNSGFDRGYLSPSADFLFNQSGNDETFFMSNMAPQVHSLNAGVWSHIEERVRNLTSMGVDVLVITGPVLTVGLPRIASGVTIPEYFYKIAYYKTADGTSKVEAYLAQNSNVRGSIDQFRTTVDHLEEMTGIDFLAVLDDSIENEIEASLN